MKIVALVARLLLGLLFVVAGANILFHIFPDPPPLPGLAGQFAGAMMLSHYMTIVGVFQLLGGLLLLANRYVPLGLTILGPIVVNIVVFHALMEHKGLPIAILVVILWGLVYLRHKQYFAGLFTQKAE